MRTFLQAASQLRLWARLGLRGKRIHDRVDGPDHPFCALVAAQPPVLHPLPFGQARLEQSEDMTRQLRPNSTLCAKARRSDD